VNPATNLAPLTLALVITNAGGVGKSTWAETLAAFGRLGGLDVVVADIDPGNRGFLNRSGDGSALSLDWALRSDYDPTAPADPSQWYEDHLAGRQLAILDTGANMLAAASPINQFIGGLILVARKKGARVIVYGVTSPNKAGSDELVELMYQRFHRDTDVVIVQNDRDGSNSFAPSLSSIGAPIVSLPFIEPGLQEVRLRRKIPLEDVLIRPEPGYERATAMLAKRLLQAARQDSVVDVVGRGAIAALEQIATAAPSSVYYQIPRISFASNAAIGVSEKLSAAWHQFRRSQKVDHEAFLKTAHALWDAEREWQELSV
jgi:hypothetical protein